MQTDLYFNYGRPNSFFTVLPTHLSIEENYSDNF